MGILALFLIYTLGFEIWDQLVSNMASERFSLPL